MKTQKSYMMVKKVLSIFSLTLFLFSCSSDEAYIGTYVLSPVDKAASIQQIIELKEQGRGVWKTSDDEVSFTWNIKKGELRLHFKPSGIVVGELKDNAIDIQLPGSVSSKFVRKSDS